eukprot:4723114-Amphidinium_carterae.1
MVSSSSGLPNYPWMNEGMDGLPKYAWTPDVVDGKDDVARTSFWHSDSEDEEEGEMTQEQAEEKMFEFLLNEHYGGRMSAKAVGVVAYYAWKGGMGLLQHLATPPDSHTSNFKRKIEQTTGKAEMLHPPYVIEVPGYIQHTQARGTHALSTHPLHELLADDLKEHGIDNVKSHVLANPDSVGPSYWASELHALPGPGI